MAGLSSADLGQTVTMAGLSSADLGLMNLKINDRTIWGHELVKEMK